MDYAILTIIHEAPSAHAHTRDENESIVPASKQKSLFYVGFCSGVVYVHYTILGCRAASISRNNS